MKTNFINRFTLATAAIVFSLVIYSCQKENSQDNASTVTVSENDAATYSDETAQAEASFDDVEDISMIAAEEEGVTSAPNGRIFLFHDLRIRLGNCATITVSPNDSTYPKTVTIDFGDGCMCADGKFRKGKIFLYLTGPIRRSGSVLTITFQNFYLNEKHIEGTKIISNLSENGNIKYTVQVVGAKVTFPNGRGYKYEGLKYKRQVDGGTTPTRIDDVYKIEGRSKTEFNNGLVITLETQTALVKKVACNWINDGVLKIKINDRTLLLDYGAPHNGDCDNKAMLNWHNGDSTRLVTLP